MQSGYLTRRPLVLGLAKILVVVLGQLPVVQAVPLPFGTFALHVQKKEEEADDPNFWLHLGIAAALVLLGGAFAGLTIALMGQDEMYLEVMRQSGEGSEKRHAEKVLSLLRRGKHWVLVTLLLGNVITNETLPIVLDRCLGGGLPAVLGSTVLIVIFGEVAPQSVCVRYGLPIGAWMSPFVLILMYILAPVAWPTAKLLDWLLGEDHGTVYKKAGLKTLVSLHKSMGEVGQQLNTDEVTIIGAVLDLKDKAIGSIMTPMDDVFTLSLDDVLDEVTMDDILSQGYSRIPVHHPDNDENFVGMLLVKMLITYDPEDAKPVRDFALATLPETRPQTSCLDIINFFQEGKSHMILVSDYPGDDHGALGVVTLEDVIEEMIGEEIVDESDVFIDVHRAIRRSIPAPRTRIPKVAVSTATATGAPVIHGNLVDIEENNKLSAQDLQSSNQVETPNSQPSLARRRSSAGQSNSGENKRPRKVNTEELKEHLKHLGPSNLASRPKTTRYNTVKIKPGADASTTKAPEPRTPSIRHMSQSEMDYFAGIGEGVVRSGGKAASDGVMALQKGYGTISNSPDDKRPMSASKAVQADPDELPVPEIHADDDDEQTDDHVLRISISKRPSDKRSGSHSTLGSLRSNSNSKRPRSKSPYFHHDGPAVSGSITENIIDTNGIRKVVLEMTSSSDSNEEDENGGTNKGHKKQNSQSSTNGHNNSGGKQQENTGYDNGDGTVTKKKKRRKRRDGNKNAAGEEQSLLENQH